MSKKKPNGKPHSSVYVPDILKDAIAARLDDPEAEMALPSLFPCMMPQYDASTMTRQAGKITIQAEGAHWRVQLDLPTEVLTGRIAASSLVTALQELNLAIHEKRIAWSPGWQRQKKKLPTVDELIQ